MSDTQRGNVIGISASKGAAILSKEFNPYQTEFSIWQGWIEKIHPGINSDMGFIMPERPEGPALRWGLAFEDAICRLAEEKRGSEIYDKERFLCSRYKGVPMLGYIDGSYYDSDALHEAKTTSYYYWRGNFGEPGTDRVPASYQIQCQHYMLLTGATETILSVLVFPKRVDEFEKEGWTTNNLNELVKLNDMYACVDIVNPTNWAKTLDEMGYFHQYVIQSNQRLQKMMLRAYHEWWEKYIIGCTPPEPENYDDIIRMCNAPVGTIICYDDDLCNRKTSVYKEINSDIKKLNQDKSDIRLDVLNYARNNTRQTVQTCPVDRHMRYGLCIGQCGLDRCIVGDKVSAIDDNSRDKWLILTPDGKKVASWSNKNGKFSFR